MLSTSDNPVAVAHWVTNELMAALRERQHNLAQSEVTPAQVRERVAPGTSSKETSGGATADAASASANL